MRLGWYVGQKVRCVRRGTLEFAPKDSFLGGSPLRYHWPAKGGTYTIRKIFLGDGFSAFWLKELLADDFVSYHEDLFLPLEEVKEIVETEICALV